MSKEENKLKKKEKRPINKAKFAQSVIILILIAAMLLSAAGTLIYYILMK